MSDTPSMNSTKDSHVPSTTKGQKWEGMKDRKKAKGKRYFKKEEPKTTRPTIFE